MPVILAMVASVLAAIGGVAAVADRDDTITPYYVITAPLAMAAALGLTGASGFAGLVVARLIALGLVGASAFIGTLLVFAQVMCGCSRPTPLPDPLLFGIPVTILHLAGSFGTAGLVAIAAILEYRSRPSRPVDAPPDKQEPS